MTRHETFDIEVLRQPTRTAIHGSYVLSTDIDGVVQLGLTEDDARAICVSILESGGLAQLLPVSYRTASIGQADARKIAEQRLADIRANNAHNYGELALGEVNQLTWSFEAADTTAQEEGWAPGLAIFHVDRLDGHVWSWADIREWHDRSGWRR